MPVDWELGQHFPFRADTKGKECGVPVVRVVRCAVFVKILLPNGGPIEGAAKGQDRSVRPGKELIQRKALDLSVLRDLREDGCLDGDLPPVTPICGRGVEPALKSAALAFFCYHRIETLSGEQEACGILPAQIQGPILGFIEGSRLLRLLLREGAARCQNRHGQSQHQRPGSGFGAACDQSDPLSQGLSPAGHAWDGTEDPEALRAAQLDQRTSIGRPLGVPQPDNRALVAGQLPVSLGQQRRQPYQRIVPVQGQGEAAQPRPKQIAVTEMSLLMGQRMAQRGLVLPQSGRQINSRAKDSGQAWRFQPWAAVDRQPGICIFHALTAPAQA